MVFNESDDYNQNNSIFNSPELQGPPPLPDQGSVSGGVLDMFNTFVEKFVDEPKRKLELKNFQKQIDKQLGPTEEIFKIFYSFGCNLYVNEGFIEIEYPQLNLKGVITIKDGKAEFDETTTKIMEHLARLVNGTNNFGQFMDKYEDEKFYPASDLERQEITYKGENITVLTGTLMNKQGQTKQVYYYKGQEINPDEE